MNPTSRPQRFTARAKLVERMRERLESQSAPRLQMSLIVSLTGLAGLLASASLLKLGLHSMALRYPAALLIAYGAFLGLLWLWLRSRAEDWADLGDRMNYVVDFFRTRQQDRGLYAQPFSDEQVALIGSPNQVEAIMSNMEKRAANYVD